LKLHEVIHKNGVKLTKSHEFKEEFVSLYLFYIYGSISFIYYEIFLWSYEVKYEIISIMEQ